jgi:hypothetical protein
MKDKRYLLNSGLFLKLSAGARYKETRQTGSILKAEIIKDKRFLKLRGVQILSYNDCIKKNCHAIV